MRQNSGVKQFIQRTRLPRNGHLRANATLALNLLAIETGIS